MAAAHPTDLPGISRLRRLSGVDAPSPSTMPLANRLVRSPWLWGSLVLVLVTFVGEAVREAFDPKKFTTYQ